MTRSVFSYRNGVLCAEAIPLAEIAEDIETPFYCTSATQLKRNYESFVAPLAKLNPSIHYALRANATLAVIRTLAACGAGAQVTSVGELERALEAGVKPEKIVFAGVGKTRDDLAAALLAGVSRIHIESLSELTLLAQVAEVLGKNAPVVLRLNMGLWAKSCEGPTLDLGDGKFGLSIDQIAPALGLIMENPQILRFKGLSVHLGANMKNAGLFRKAFIRLASVVGLLRAQDVQVEHLDLGSGVGMVSSQTGRDIFPAYAKTVRETLGGLGCALSFAPGRRLVGDAGVLVTRLLHVKESAGRRFYVVDAGMNDIVRPALSGASHEIIPVREAQKASQLARVSIVGPVSEASDQFGDCYLMPEAKEGDLLTIMHAGAYGSTMASTYNGRALVPEVLVSGAQYGIARRRVAVAEQMEWEAFPDWMDQASAA